VRFGRQGPELGIVVGKLLDGPDAQRRYVANVLPTDDNTMRQLLEGDPIGATGHVSFSKNKSFFSACSLPQLGFNGKCLLACVALLNCSDKTWC